MELQITEEQQYYIITVSGDLDASSSVKLDDELTSAVEKGKNVILIDFSGLNYISSPGIGVFTSRLEDCESGKLFLAIYGVSDKVMKVFKLLGLDKLMPILNTKDDAKRHVQSLQKKSKL
ncbi:MAG: STAS domain-containing protein [Cytophagales bacterium]|nr:STAS domain-containing protein [Cytophagales bacterium]MDW8384479.1 STAS domain-containing protein [Flammeovirgaceae bacterium]